MHLEIQTRQFHRHVEEKKDEHEHPLIFEETLLTRTVAFVALGEAAVECAVDWDVDVMKRGRAKGSMANSFDYEDCHESRRFPR